ARSSRVVSFQVEYAVWARSMIAVISSPVAAGTSRTTAPVVGSMAVSMVMIRLLLSEGRRGDGRDRREGPGTALVDDEVLGKGEEGGAAVGGDPAGVRDADGLVPVHAPHPRDQMEGHALLERPLVALVEGDDVALVPGGREGDADRVPGAGDQLGSHVVALDQGPGEPVHLGDAHPGLH